MFSGKEERLEESISHACVSEGSKALVNFVPFIPLSAIPFNLVTSCQVHFCYIKSK
jgi:hypothetical protein